MENIKSYYMDVIKSKKYCFVPKCQSTSNRTPGKLFFSVPKDPKLREKWCRAIKRDEKQKGKLSTKSTHYCCEDHFNVEDDMENYMQHKLTNQVRKNILKPGVLPHRFDCQKEQQLIERQPAAEKIRLHLIEEAISQARLISLSLKLEANSRAAAETNEETHSNEGVNSNEDTDDSKEGVNSIKETYSNRVNFYKEADSNPRVKSNEEADSCVKDCKPKFNEASTTSQENNSLEEKLFKSTNAGTNLMCESPATSPIKFPVKVEVSSNNFMDLIPDSPVNISNDETYVSSPGESFVSSPDETCVTSPGESSVSSPDESSESSFEEDEHLMRVQMCKYTMFYIEKNPMLFLGVSENSFFVIKMIQERTKLPLKNIYIALKKIRSSHSFEALAIDFGLSESQTRKIFKTSLPQISAVLKTLVFWPSPEEVFMRLPIPFRLHYNKVCFIIYCLEIQIERPRKRVHQYLTWSNYYNCHTLKFLISYTPDGLINFFSEGFGGNTTDALIVESSNFLEKLSPGSQVMVDKGFEGIDHLLLRKNCTLVRLPCVSAGVKSSRAEVEQSEITAAVRIYVEQFIKRTREYRLLLPCSCLDKSLTAYIDDIVGSVCGLLNMQEGFFLKNSV